jgi:nucleoside phosphorylase
MEGSGIADATWNLEKGSMVVRGTCDYCDTHKNDVWQEYAAAVAAGYTRALIESIPTSSSR